MSARIRSAASGERRVLDHTRQRLFGGDPHVPDKGLSVFEPHTEAIRKGKLVKPTEFELPQAVTNF